MQPAKVKDSIRSNANTTNIKERNKNPGISGTAIRETKAEKNEWKKNTPKKEKGRDLFINSTDDRESPEWNEKKNNSRKFMDEQSDPLVNAVDADKTSVKSNSSPTIEKCLSPPYASVSQQNTIPLYTIDITKSLVNISTPDVLANENTVTNDIHKTEEGVNPNLILAKSNTLPVIESTIRLDYMTLAKLGLCDAVTEAVKKEHEMEWLDQQLNRPSLKRHVSIYHYVTKSLVVFFYKAMIFFEVIHLPNNVMNLLLIKVNDVSSRNRSCRDFSVTEGALTISTLRLTSTETTTDDMSENVPLIDHDHDVDIISPTSVVQSAYDCNGKAAYTVLNMRTPLYSSGEKQRFLMIQSLHGAKKEELDVVKINSAFLLKSENIADLERGLLTEQQTYTACEEAAALWDEINYRRMLDPYSTYGQMTQNALINAFHQKLVKKQSKNDNCYRVRKDDSVSACCVFHQLREVDVIPPFLFPKGHLVGHSATKSFVDILLLIPELLENAIAKLLVNPLIPGNFIINDPSDHNMMMVMESIIHVDGLESSKTFSGGYNVMDVSNSFTISFLRDIDVKFGNSNLFMRSLILLNAWAFFDAQIMGSQTGYIDTYSLSVLLIAMMNQLPVDVVSNGILVDTQQELLENLTGMKKSGGSNKISSYDKMNEDEREGVLEDVTYINNAEERRHQLTPFKILMLMLEYYSNFNFDEYVVTIFGPVPVSEIHRANQENVKAAEKAVAFENNRNVVTDTNDVVADSLSTSIKQSLQHVNGENIIGKVAYSSSRNGSLSDVNNSFVGSALRDEATTCRPRVPEDNGVLDGVEAILKNAPGVVGPPDHLRYTNGVLDEEFIDSWVANYVDTDEELRNKQDTFYNSAERSIQVNFFPVSLMNVRDPIKPYNNLCKDVCRHDLARIQRCFRKESSSLKNSVLQMCYICPISSQYHLVVPSLTEDKLHKTNSSVNSNDNTDIGAVSTTVVTAATNTPNKNRKFAGRRILSHLLRTPSGVFFSSPPALSFMGNTHEKVESGGCEESDRPTKNIILSPLINVNEFIRNHFNGTFEAISGLYSSSVRTNTGDSSFVNSVLKEEEERGMKRCNSSHILADCRVLPHTNTMNSGYHNSPAHIQLPLEGNQALYPNNHDPSQKPQHSLQNRAPEYNRSGGIVPHHQRHMPVNSRGGGMRGGRHNEKRGSYGDMYGGDSGHYRHKSNIAPKDHQGTLGSPVPADRIGSYNDDTTINNHNHHQHNQRHHHNNAPNYQGISNSHISPQNTIENRPQQNLGHNPHSTSRGDSFPSPSYAASYRITSPQYLGSCVPHQQNPQPVSREQSSFRSAENYQQNSHPHPGFPSPTSMNLNAATGGPLQENYSTSKDNFYNNSGIHMYTNSTGSRGVTRGGPSRGGHAHNTNQYRNCNQQYTAPRNHQHLQHSSGTGVGNTLGSPPHQQHQGTVYNNVPQGYHQSHNVSVNRDNIYYSTRGDFSTTPPLNNYNDGGAHAHQQRGLDQSPGDVSAQNINNINTVGTETQNSRGTGRGRVGRIRGRYQPIKTRSEE